MLGAIAGDIIGSTREWCNVKSKDFELLAPGSRFTDDTVMTLAVAKWLTVDLTHSTSVLVECMQQLGRKYPNAGYGGSFSRWLCVNNPQPYNSWGNGSSMRVSPVGLYAKTIEEVLSLAEISAAVSHNHPEGIKGAQAIALCVYMAKNLQVDNIDQMKAAIKDTVVRLFGYNLNRTIDEIRPEYQFDVSCQGSVPEAIIAYLEGDSFEDAIRNAISVGGDSDTIAAMTGAIAHAQTYNPSLHKYHEQYSIPRAAELDALLTIDLREIMDDFEHLVSDNTSSTDNTDK